MDTVTITLVSSTITGVITFILGTKKKNKELIGLDLNNISQSITIYQTIIEDMKEQIKSMSDKIDKLECSVEELVKENNHLKELLENVPNT
jgi:FtsZ-binding cell division protein ZapB